MSLLHKALKKAEREGTNPSGSNVFVDTEEPSVSPSRLRLLILSGLAAIAIAAVIYARFSASSRSEIISQPKEFSTPLGIAGGGTVEDHFLQGQKMMAMGRPHEAHIHFEKAVLMEPRNAQAYNDLGLALKKSGHREEAMEQYLKALSIDPQCAPCLNNRGVLHMEGLNLTEAEEDFGKAIASHPSYADPWFHRALVLEAQGDLGEAKKNYEKFIELSRDIDAPFILRIQERVAGLGGS